MIRKSIKHFIKVAELIACLFAVVLLAVSLVVLFSFWKLSNGPVDMTWAQPYIQDALGGDKAGIEVKAEGIVAEWKSFDAPLTLGIANLSINEQGSEILSVSQAGLRLAKWPLLVGIVSPEAIFIKNPSIRLEKSAEGKLSFLIANREVKDTGNTKLNPEELGESLFLGGFLTDTSRLPMSRLESVVIEDANITIDDKQQQMTHAMPNADLTLLRDTNDVNLVMEYDAQTGDKSKINAVLVRKPFENRIKFILNLHNVETELWALNLPKLPGLMRDDYSFEGQITGIFNLEWALRNLGGTITTSYQGEQKQSFSIAANRDSGTGIIPIELSLAEVSLDQIASVWPEELQGLSVTEWFTQKLSKGVIKNLVMTLPFKNENGSWKLAGNTTATLDFENLTCDYRAPLYPITEGYGRATVADDVLTITIDKAKLENLDIKKGSVVITHLTAPDHVTGNVEVKVALQGPLSTAFKYISLEPISLGEKLKVDPAKVEGKGDIDVTVNFPALKDLPADQVVVAVNATLMDTKLPGIVHGMDLSGGPLKLNVEKGAFAISGNGALDGTPMEFSYSEYLNPENAPYVTDVKAKLVTDDAIRQKLGIDISDYISGKAGVDIAMQEKTNGTTDLDVKADLTPSRTFVTPLNYLKPEGVAGSATAKLLLKGKTIQSVKDLNVKIGKDEVTGGQLQFGMVGKENNVTSASFDRIKLGDANDMKLKIEQNASLLKLNATGSSIDARGFLNDKTESKTPRSRDVDMTVGTSSMRMGDAADQVLKNPNMNVVVNPEGQVKKLDLKAKVGQGDLSVNLSPGTRGVMNLRMDSNDAGAALNAMGAYQNMRGGTLSLSGAQMPGGKINDIQGAALIENFRVVKAPALAKIIGAFSITGLPELLANEGISFSKLKSKFIWKETPQGRVINLYDGATSGGSVGLTFGGIINQTNDTLDLNGTFVPISQINKIVSSIPVVGQLLTGGKNGGIIAATYTLKGPTSDPSVMINPLSVLAPGFLRSILFEGGLNSGRDEKPVLKGGRRPN